MKCSVFLGSLESVFHFALYYLYILHIQEVPRQFILTSILLIDTLDSANIARANGKKILQASCSRLKYCTKENVILARMCPPITTKVTTAQNKMNLSVKTIRAVENPFIIEVRIMNFTSSL